MIENNMIDVKKKLDEVYAAISDGIAEAKWVDREYQGYIKCFEYYDTLFGAIITFYDEKSKSDIQAYVCQDITQKHLHKTLKITCLAEESACSIPIWRNSEITILSEESEKGFLARVYEDKKEYLEVMDAYTHLTEEQREDCLNFLKRFLGEYYDRSKKVVIYNSNTERWRYTVCHNGFPEDIRKAIETHLLPNILPAGHKGPGSGSDECLEASSKRALDSLYNIDFGVKSNGISRGFKERLGEFHIGDEDFISEFVTNVSGNNSSVIRPILIINKNGGLPDLLKTIRMNTYLKMEEIEASALTSDREAYSGSSILYANSDPGIFYHRLLSMGNLYSLMVIKNVDAIDDSMATVLTPLLAEKRYYNKSIECQFNLDRMILLLTANSLDEVPTSIASACDIITLDYYSEKETRYIVFRTIDELNYKNHMMVDLSKNAMKKLINSYCSNGDVHMLSTKLEYIYKQLCEAGINKAHITESTLLKYLPELAEVNIKRLIIEKPTKYIDLVDKYTKLRGRYSSSYTECIDAQVCKYKRLKTGDPDKEKALQVLELAVNSVSNPTVLDWDKVKVDCAKSHLCIEKKTNEMVNVLMSKKPLLLYGPAGVGKTTLAQSISLSLGIYFKVVSLNNLEDLDYFEGSKAKPGVLLKMLAESTSQDIIVVLDEFDKASIPVQNCLLDLLDGTNHVVDKYSSLPIDMSRFHFIATGNSNMLTDHVKDRLVEIEMKGYSKNQKKHILFEAIIPSAEKEFEVEISMEDEVAEYLVECYCPTPGVRDLPKMISKLVMAKTNGDKDIIVSTDDINRILGESISIKALESDFDTELEPGIALGLAVCSDGRGTIIQNQIKILENGKEDIITGLVEGSAKEAFFVAKAVAASVIGTKEEKTYAYHSCDASVKKDGSSAGLTLSMAMLSSYYNKDLTGFSFTGEIDLCGNVHAIGGVYQKLEASNDSSAIKTVYIPMANYKKLALSDELKCFENIKIVGVSTVAELAKEVFG